MMTTLYIKNMVCQRCIMVVQQQMDALHLQVADIKLGEVKLKETLQGEQREALKAALLPLGFELIDDRRSRLIEEIKVAIIDLVHHQGMDAKTNLSDHLSATLQHDYAYLSALFSKVEGSTIEKYFIAQRIEKVKEMLVYDELSLSEIALRLNYSSVAYLSNQFKKVTGLTPSHFKQLGRDRRKGLDQV